MADADLLQIGSIGQEQTENLRKRAGRVNSSCKVTHDAVLRQAVGFFLW